MSKEEILEKCMAESPMETGSEIVCLKVMSEYAEKVAVAFAEWKDDNVWGKNETTFIYFKTDGSYTHIDTIPELYQYFIENVYNK